MVHPAIVGGSPCRPVLPLFRNHTQRLLTSVRIKRTTELVDVGPRILGLHPGEFVLGSTWKRVGLPMIWSPDWRARVRLGDWVCSSIRLPVS